MSIQTNSPGTTPPAHREENLEKVSYNIPGFPSYIRKGALSFYQNYSADIHWHEDVEFMYILSGAMQYNIDGQLIDLHTGEGLFVNSRHLHYGFSAAHEESRFICYLFHPSLLHSSGYIGQNYLLPILKNDGIPFLILHENKTYESEILHILLEIYHCRSSHVFPLKLQSLLFKLWENLYLLSGDIQKKAPDHRHLDLLKNMIQFIYDHYGEKITLKDISLAGNVGKTTCINIFQKYTNETPVSYLIKYRLKKGAALLSQTDKSVSEICFETGFSSPSYFTGTFRRIYGCSPKEYRS